MSHLATFTITRRKLVVLKKLYADAIDREINSITYEDRHFAVAYLKYMIEYADMRLNHSDPNDEVKFRTGK